MSNNCLFDCQIDTFSNFHLEIKQLKIRHKFGKDFTRHTHSVEIDLGVHNERTRNGVGWGCWNKVGWWTRVSPSECERVVPREHVIGGRRARLFTFVCCGCVVRTGVLTRAPGLHTFTPHPPPARPHGPDQYCHRRPSLLQRRATYQLCERSARFGRNCMPFGS